LTCGTRTQGHPQPPDESPEHVRIETDPNPHKNLTKFVNLLPRKSLYKYLCFTSIFALKNPRFHAARPPKLLAGVRLGRHGFSSIPTDTGNRRDFPPPEPPSTTPSPAAPRRRCREQQPTSTTPLFASTIRTSSSPLPSWILAELVAAASAGPHHLQRQKRTSENAQDPSEQSRTLFLSSPSPGTSTASRVRVWRRRLGQPNQLLVRLNEFRSVHSRFQHISCRSLDVHLRFHVCSLTWTMCDSSRSCVSWPIDQLAYTS
jgi:hypothetical protein